MVKKIVTKHGVTVYADYKSIEAVRDICEPWINLWGGDEWGDSMFSLHGACHTSYGFSDEDCALFASRLVNNLCVMHQWVVDEGNCYGFTDHEPTAIAETKEKRAYWLEGGNLKGIGDNSQVQETIESMPKWLFGESDEESGN